MHPPPGGTEEEETMLPGWHSGGCGTPYPPVAPFPSLLGQLAADLSPAGRQPGYAAGHC